MNGVGVIGTGFMGVAHTEALRRLGLDVVGIVGSSPERARAKAAASPLPPVYDSVEALLADPAVGTVHVTSPNHLHAEHARAAIDAGKHVVCEKPLGVSSAETADLLARADAAGVVHAVCFNLRYYAAEPERRRPRRRRRRRRAALRHRPLPPGLAAARDRLELASRRRSPGRACGPSPTSGRTGSTSPASSPGATSSRCSPTCTRSCTERNHPVGEVETFGAATVADDVERVRERMESDDAAGLLLRYEDGLRGTCTISQVSAGRKNTRRVGAGRRRRRGGVGVGGPRAAVARPSRPAQRGRREGRRDDDAGRRRRRRVPGRPRRGLPRHVPRPVRRRLP